jgi:hypothetical protein
LFLCFSNSKNICISLVCTSNDIKTFNLVLK